MLLPSWSTPATSIPSRPARHSLTNNPCAVPILFSEAGALRKAHLSLPSTDFRPALGPSSSPLFRHKMSKT